MILGGIIALRLPNYPETAPWLSPADRSLAIARGRDGETHESSSSNQQFLTGSLPPPLIIIDGYGLSGPLRDPALWLLTLAFYLAWVPLDALLSLGTQICASSFNLSPGLISSMSSGNGTTSLITTLAVTNGGIGSSLWGTLDGRVSASFLAFLPFLGGLPLSVYLSHRTDERGSRVHMASAGLLLASIGSLFLALIPPLAPGGGPARYLFGYVPSILGLVIGLPILLAQSLDGVSGDCARCVRAACVTGFGLCASSTLWPALLFPLQASPGYALGHLLHSIMCIGCIISLQSLRRWFKSGSGLDEPLWTVPPGLTRLLNDVEEGKAWETVELKTTQIKRTVQEAVLGRKLEEPAPVSVAEAPRVVSPSVPVAVEDHPSSFQPIDNDDDDEEGFTNVY